MVEKEGRERRRKVKYTIHTVATAIADTGEERKKGKINFHLGIELPPRDWESSTLSTRPLPRTKVFSPFFAMYYVLKLLLTLDTFLSR